MKFHRLLKHQGMTVLTKDNCTWSKLSMLLRNTSRGSFGVCSSSKRSCLSKTYQANQLTKYNPISELQPFVAVPIIPDGTVPFNPSESEIKSASTFFEPKTKLHEIKHIKTAAKIPDLPTYDIPEVAFIGRSNVGKSSLIKTLFSKAPNEVLRKLSVSSKPGRTKALQLYQAGEVFTLVDMPGYGHHMPHYFTDCVESYFKQRTNLEMVFILIDGEIGLTSLDKEMLEKLQVFSAVHCMVLTKIDKANRHRLLGNLMSVMQYRDKHNKYCLPQPFLVSAHTGEGIELLKTFIAYVTGNMLVIGS
ncbi:GTP-binding protein 8-like isoform X1 [Pecten maximus]|uniref:GTP-binding protein 8-like isoform X1 n=1 Tax=Pecten maximus TaxID=6579 RepID=UPI0014584725|nr:GTP-binding protein 8-like isoform X1 [Pecten maximus]XP_033743158.1 GTP-binding protein 8-like isoform X1 [Pecten maximus]